MGPSAIVDGTVPEIKSERKAWPLMERKKTMLLHVLLVYEIGEWYFVSLYFIAEDSVYRLFLESQREGHEYMVNGRIWKGILMCKKPVIRMTGPFGFEETVMIWG